MSSSTAERPVAPGVCNLEESFGRLAEKDATLGAILDNLSEGVVATDARGTVVFANPAGRAMLSMGEEDAELPSPWEDFDLREAVVSSARKREGGEASVRGGKSFLRIKLEYVPNLGDSGKDGVLIVSQDLSEGRRLEETQQKFLARAAHQLRTPLSAITFAAELLVTKGDDPVARRRFLEHILTGAERMQRLSDSLLKLARVGWGTRAPERAWETSPCSSVGNEDHDRHADQEVQHGDPKGEPLQPPSPESQHLGHFGIPGRLLSLGQLHQASPAQK